MVTAPFAEILDYTTITQNRQLAASQRLAVWAFLLDWAGAGASFRDYQHLPNFGLLVPYLVK